LTSPNDSLAIWPGKAIAAINDTSSMMVLTEEGNAGVMSTNDALQNMFNSAYATNPSVSGYDYGAYSQRHSGGCNFMFVDMHVKWLLATGPAALNAASGSAATVCPN
jgi:prepilin-type processing-associated H-X9-DG protein